MTGYTTPDAVVMKRICSHCYRSLQRREKESESDFVTRIFCDRKCYRKHQRSRPRGKRTF